MKAVISPQVHCHMLPQEVRLPLSTDQRVKLLLKTVHGREKGCPPHIAIRCFNFILWEKKKKKTETESTAFP